MTTGENLKASRWPGLVFALQFLTILPVKTDQRFDARAALPLFPICGLLIGAALVAVDAAASMLWPRPVVAVVDLLLLALISGALHLDGLADSADGLYGGRDSAQALRIMKDSRVGAMGVVALICCLAVKWAGLAHLGEHSSLWLFLVPAYARGSVLIAARLMPYGRDDRGLGSAFFQSPTRPSDFWGLGLALLLALTAGWRAMGVILVYALMVFSILALYRRKTGCLTGDMLGAMIEVTEAALFLIAASRWVG